AVTRVDRMKREVEETAFWTEVERAHHTATWSKILVAQTSVGKQNCWEVDVEVEALGADKLPVFVKVLEVLKIDFQCHLDAMDSSRKENRQP
uniref:Uncharacterized protein n=1 Tax=Setaria italica TaxID=4555 RepID=A0A0Q3V0I7_SETIT